MAALVCACITVIFISGFFVALSNDLASAAAHEIVTTVSRGYHDIFDGKTGDARHKATGGHSAGMSPASDRRQSRSNVTGLRRKTSPAPVATRTPRPTAQSSVPTSAPSTGNISALGGVVGLGPSSVSSRLSLDIGEIGVPEVLGLPLNLPDLAWTATVTFNGRVVVQGCHMDWALMDGTATVYQTTTPCNGLIKLNLNLDVGNLTLQAKAVLQSGATVQRVIRVRP